MASKQIVKARKHKVKDGESIKSLAKQAGITWQELAKFNWGTDVPERIEKYLREKVGCFKKTKDGCNYIFTSDDDPGIIYIPEPMPDKLFSTSSTNMLTVKLIDHKAVIQSDCFVRFRPKPNWKGEYGFDWMRDQLHYEIADAPAVGGIPAIGDIEFKDIIGKHYEDVSQTVLINDINGYSRNFKKDNILFTALEGEYYKGSDILFSDGTVNENYASYLSIYMKENDAPVPIEIQAFVTIKETALDELRFAVESEDAGNLTISSSTSLFKLSPGDHKLPIKIQLQKTLSSAILIKANAITRNPDGSNRTTTVGRLFVVANDKSHRKIKRVVVVEIEAGRIKWKGKKILDKKNQENYLKKFLNQALVNPEIDFVKIDVSKDEAFKNYYTYNSDIVADNRYDNSFIPIHQELTNRLNAQFANKYASYLKLFYLGSDGGSLEKDKDGNYVIWQLAGYASGKDKVVLFDVTSPGVMAHEVLHTLNLDHTFYNFAGCTYKVFNTENIMDYTDIRRGMENSTISLYHWQWVLANNSADPEPELVGDFPVLPNNIA
jgi:hypothetical protein